MKLQLRNKFIKIQSMFPTPPKNFFLGLLKSADKSMDMAECPRTVHGLVKKSMDSPWTIGFLHLDMSVDNKKSITSGSAVSFSAQKASLHSSAL